MPPARASLEGPFARSLREALESVAAGEMVPRLVSASLELARRGAVPEDAAPFASFVEGPLRTVVVRTLGDASYEVVAERLAHVLLMATSQVRAKERGDDDRDEASQVRLADAARDARALDEPVDATPLPPPPRIGAQTLGRLIAAPRANAIVEHDARPIGRPRTQDTVRPPRNAPTRVLLATLDPLLVTETEARLAGRSAVFAVGTTVELSAQIAIAGGRVAVVIDTALPSIDVPSFAALASTFPPGTPVVLWGMSDRQKQRLVTVFPIAESWIASGVAASPADLLVDG